VFFYLNYVSDIVLLAHKMVDAYVTANVIGTGAVLLSLFFAVHHAWTRWGLAGFSDEAAIAQCLVQFWRGTWVVAISCRFCDTCCGDAIVFAG
jgi:hypothetical protein